MAKTVFGIAKTPEQADRIVNRLQNAHFAYENVSVLFSNKDNRYAGELETWGKGAKKTGLATEKHTKAPEGAAAGATAGGLIGGSLGLLTGIGALAIPGIGPFIAAGPIMAALGGAAIGGSVGLLTGALVGLGVPEYEAKTYEDSLKAGHVLISVHTESSEESDRAKDILQKEGAQDISSCSARSKAGTKY